MDEHEQAVDDRASTLTQREEEDAESDRRQCDVFLDRFAAMMNHGKVGAFLEDQEHMLETLEVTNEKLASLNKLSESKYQRVVMEFRQNSRTLLNMKKELDSIFRRIRSLKARLASQYPQLYAAAESQYRLDDDC